MTPQINHLGKMSTVLRVSTNISGVSEEIEGKMFIFRVNLGKWPLKSNVSENEPCSEDFNAHLWHYQGHRWENVNFWPKPRHLTPQIDCLRKTSPVLRVSTHICGVSQEIVGKMFILRVNLGMWPLKLIVSGKWALFWGFQHTFMALPRTWVGKMLIFDLNLGMWPLKSIVLEKWVLFWGF